MPEHFDASWLELREPFDAAARSVPLARQLAGLLPARPHLLDLGAGTGSLFRWLAPIIGSAQAMSGVILPSANCGNSVSGGRINCCSLAIWAFI